MEKNKRMNHCEALIIGGSAGSLEVLLKVLPFLNVDIELAIIIVLHRKTGPGDLLTSLLSSRTKLPVKEAEEKEAVNVGTVYLAPPDYHLLIENDHTFSLDHFEKINYSRPSIDVSFQSAAEVYKNGLAGLLLSGANADGMAGLQQIKKYGGLTAIQEPESAAVSFMPLHALLNVKIDSVLTIKDMASFINGL